MRDTPATVGIQIMNRQGDNMDIPGIKAGHSEITDNCRNTRGNIGAVEEALKVARVTLNELVYAWPTGRGARLHVIVSVEYDRLEAKADG